MIKPNIVRQIALTFEDVIELPHFEKTSFRVNKKIFATLDATNKRVCVMLTKIDQSAFSAFDKTIIYPVPNKWGDKGATYIELDKVRPEVLKDALFVAYGTVAAKRKL